MILRFLIPSAIVWIDGINIFWRKFFDLCTIARKEILILYLLYLLLTFSINEEDLLIEILSFSLKKN